MSHVCQFVCLDWFLEDCHTHSFPNSERLPASSVPSYCICSQLSNFPIFIYLHFSGYTEKLSPTGSVHMNLKNWCGLHRHKKIWCLFQGLAFLWHHSSVPLKNIAGQQIQVEARGWFGAEFPSCFHVTWFLAYKLTVEISLKRVTATLHGVSYTWKFTGIGIYFE